MGKFENSDIDEQIIIDLENKMKQCMDEYGNMTLGYHDTYKALKLAKNSKDEAAIKEAQRNHQKTIENDNDKRIENGKKYNELYLELIKILTSIRIPKTYHIRDGCHNCVYGFDMGGETSGEQLICTIRKPNIKTERLYSNYDHTSSGTSKDIFYCRQVESSGYCDGHKKE
ncbi:MAG: hypothetical protein AABY32_00945 [Nanoarchaeota archaeon]